MADGDGGGDNVIISEHRGAFSPIKKYVVDQEDSIKVVIQGFQGDHDRVGVGLLQGLRLTLRQVFLPYGYPKSVSKDYVAYQIWDTLQAFASSITGALATEAVMKGVGVGELGRTPLAAALTWLLKSGSGHIGQILFAWAKGTSLDHDCKKWRLFADALNDVAIFIDLISPLFPPDTVVFVLCSSSVARALVGVAGSATRAAVTQHQARMNNTADVSAKDGSQETLVNLMALITSLILLPVVSGKKLLVWMLFMVFTFVHLIANYKAVKSLEIEALNRSRLLICLQDFIATRKLSSVKSVNDRESVILGRGLKDRDVCGMDIRLGVSLEKVLSSITTRKRRAYLERLLLHYSSKPFIIIPGAKTVNVILHDNIRGEEILEAFCRGVFLALAVIRNIDNLSKGDTLVASTTNAMDHAISKEWDTFHNLAHCQGFVFTQAPLESGEWRAKWMHS